ncbi:c-type cytochrome [Paraburkholderia tropica]|uniref:c-type cytochrome n=1 Tax=Paraburkholderia tropica TaxID=92647 RepID=UPI002AB6DC7F|nr:cytochrome c [Paraburkholderia tropica]
MNNTFKKLGLSVIGIGIAAAVAYAAGVTYDLHKSYAISDTSVNDEVAPTQAQIQHGLYVAHAADCAACHTAQGGKPFAGGYAIGTPFGQIESSNITSDKETGIGNWTLAQFDRAVRHGKGTHGYLYPAMPYTAYSQMTDGDVRDLWAYMRTVAPVENRVIEDKLPFPFNQRWLMGGWNLLFFKPQVFKADPTKSVDYNRGAYLVEGPGHCAACHTGKNFLGGDTADFLQGGSLDGWYAPDITPNPHAGIGTWSEADIAAYLKAGSNDKAVSTGPMTEAVENSTQYLTDADLHAIAVYLKAQTPSTTTAPAAVSADDSAMKLGQRVYESQCIACHVSNGNGVRKMIPPFAGSSIVKASDPATLLHMVLLGSDGPQTETNPTGAGMPRFDWKLSDDEVAAVLTYVRNSWGNAAPPVSQTSAQQARAKLGAQAWIGH